VQIIAPRSIEELRGITRESAVDAAITLLPRGWQEGQSLSRELPIYSLHYPALFVFLEERLDKRAVEFLRVAGAVALEQPAEASALFKRVLEGGLVGSDSSVMEKLNQAARLPGPRLFTVTTGEGEHGRIYVNEGTFVGAEFMRTSGIQALSSLLCTEYARVVSYEGSLLLESQSSGERLAEALSEAIDLLEHSGKGFRLGGLSGTMYVFQVPVVGAFGEGERVAESDVALNHLGGAALGGQEAPTEASVSAENKGVLEVDKVVSEKNWRDGMGANLDEFLTKLPQISGMAEADLDGIVVRSVGAADHDTACAVASVVTAQLQRIAGCLDLGEPRCWALTGSDNSVFVGGAGNRMYVGSGPALKNVGPLMVKLFAV
jgi:predicted regulator of Ras-like GTPase activity (Roadblock/LC7/MglB family)